MFISFFFKQYKHKKVVTVAAGTKRKRPGTTTQAATSAADEEFVMDAGEDLSPEEQEIAMTLEENDNETPLEDDGQEAHDKKVVNTLRLKAIREMSAQGVIVSNTESKEAEGVLPKVLSFR